MTSLRCCGTSPRGRRRGQRGSTAERSSAGSTARKAGDHRICQRIRVDTSVSRPLSTQSTCKLYQLSRLPRCPESQTAQPDGRSTLRIMAHASPAGEERPSPVERPDHPDCRRRTARLRCQLVPAGSERKRPGRWLLGAPEPAGTRAGDAGGPGGAAATTRSRTNGDDRAREGSLLSSPQFSQPLPALTSSPPGPRVRPRPLLMANSHSLLTPPLNGPGVSDPQSPGLST